MKVSGFTFIRNALKYDYPVVEAVRSILPLCDEVVVAVGRSEDATRELVAGIDPAKVRIIDTVWDDSLREGGRVLAVETDKAKAALAPDTDWAVYIQGDEVLHENSHAAVRAAMQRHLHEPHVEGLLFDYVHFYGAYDLVGDSRRWYRREVRIVRPDAAIRSWRDAQGFRKDGRPLRVKPAHGTIHHYGWVKHPAQQQAKQKTFNALWHDDHWLKQHVGEADAYDYATIDSLAPFTGTHPAVMKERIARMNWNFTFDPAKRVRKLKDRMLMAIEKATGWRIGEYRNYRLLR